MINEGNSVLAIFEMREELLNSRRFIESRNKVALKSALHACYADAKRFFEGDEVSVRDFSSKIQLVYNLYKREDFDAAIAECGRLNSQIEMLISQLAEQKKLPAESLPLLANVLTDGMRQVGDDGVSEFDLAAGELIGDCFPNLPESRSELWGGIWKIVVRVLDGKFGDGRPGIDYLRAKQAVDEESQTEVQVAIALAKSLANQKVLNLLAQLSEQEETPLLFQFGVRLATSCEKLVGSPPQISPLPKGYVASVGWLAILALLSFNHMCPELCASMVRDVAVDS